MAHAGSSTGPGDFAAWSAAQPAPRFTEWLRQLSEPAWSEATGHRFVRELADGTLDDAVFRRYLVQDYSFLESFIRLLGAAIAAAPALPDRLPLARFLGTVSSEENTYFHRAFDALGVPEAERTAPALLPPTVGFHQVMKDAAGSGRYEHILAVLVVTEWLYLSWAKAVADRRPDRFYLAEWIQLHANPGLESFVSWLRGQLDRLGPTLPPERQQEVAELFRHTVGLEKAFFEAAYA